MAVKVHHHGPYTTRAMQIASGWAAQVFHGSTLLGPRHMGADADQAMEAARVWIEARAAAEGAIRAKTRAPSVEAYREAFAVIAMNDAERAMLNAHLAAPYHTLTATRLAEAAGWPSWSSANLHYGGLGRKVAEAVRWTPPRRPDGSEIWTMALATGHHDIEDDVIDIEQLYASLENAGQFEWVLRPQVAEAWGRKS